MQVGPISSVLSVRPPMAAASVGDVDITSFVDPSAQLHLVQRQAKVHDALAPVDPIGQGEGSSPATRWTPAESVATASAAAHTLAAEPGLIGALRQRTYGDATRTLGRTATNDASITPRGVTAAYASYRP